MDTELDVMRTVLDSLKTLENQDAQKRVIEWILKKLEITSPTISIQQIGIGSANSSILVGAEITNFNSVAELLGKVSVTTDAMRALVVAAYIQEKLGKEDFVSREINQELTNIGHPSTNITRDFDSLISKKPKLVIQLRKEGKSRQAQKKYKVTTEGLKAVRDLILGKVEVE